MSFPTSAREYSGVPANVETTLDEDLGLLLYERRKEAERSRKRCIVQGALAFVSVIALIWSVVATALVVRSRHKHGTEQERLVTRVAFGSCTARDLRPQPIWTQGVIPSSPDAWIWLGDMSYVDLPPMDAALLCRSFPSSPYCNCTLDYLHQGKGSCMAGDPDHVRKRFQQQVALPEYRAFLDFMCPRHRSAGAFPPNGGDPSVCPRPILGVYDDHDYGLNNADARLPNKHELKQFFLDALGEPPSSPRRSSMNGIQQHYVLNQGRPGREVDVVLLDGRYYRDSLPCIARSKWCETVLKGAARDGSYLWCQDFLRGGEYGQGSCCRSDEELGRWCLQARHTQSPLYPVACDPTSSQYGSRKVVLSEDDSQLLTDDVGLWGQPGSTLHSRLVKDSPICDMLGVQQREWLRAILQDSKAPLKLVASGSVLMGAINFTQGPQGTCSGDDWLCYPGAQVNLLHALANTSHGCVVLLTGDFHYSDIKVAQPGQRAYSSALYSNKLHKNVYQVMASGMSDTTAQHNGAPCEGTFREDLVGLRPLGRCSFMARPNFGMLDIDWRQQTLRLQIRDGASGNVAVGHDGTRQEVLVSLKTCQIVKH